MIHDVLASTLLDSLKTGIGALTRENMIIQSSAPVFRTIPSLVESRRNTKTKEKEVKMMLVTTADCLFSMRLTVSAI